MDNRFETILSMGTGFIVTALTSNHYFEQLAFKSILAILTGFFGALAGLLAKLLFNYIKDQISK